MLHRSALANQMRQSPRRADGCGERTVAGAESAPVRGESGRLLGGLVWVYRVKRCSYVYLQ